MSRVSLFLAGLLMCGSTVAADVAISLRTDYAASEFRYVRVELLDRSDERVSWNTVYSAQPTDPFLAGVQVAEFENVQKSHRYIVIIRLLDGLMRPVHGRLFYNRTSDADAQGDTFLVVRP